MVFSKNMEVLFTWIYFALADIIVLSFGVCDLADSPEDYLF